MAVRAKGEAPEEVSGSEPEATNNRMELRAAIEGLRRLEEALRVFTGHRFYSLIRPLAEEILAAAATIRPLPPSPDRVVHGDPKINNILFEADGKTGLCLVDLDTLGRMPLPLELGDAWIRATVEAAADDPIWEPQQAALVRMCDELHDDASISDATWSDLRQHFDEPQIVELVAVCALFGFLNRWNDTMSTELEDVPQAFAERHLSSSGWNVGKHR